MIEEYNIRNNLNYFVMNNVENNDTILIVISNKLRAIYDIHYDSIQHRFRCMNHIINLFVKVFLLDDHFDNEKIQNVSKDFNEKKLNKYKKFESQNKLLSDV